MQCGKKRFVLELKTMTSEYLDSRAGDFSLLFFRFLSKKKTKSCTGVTFKIEIASAVPFKIKEVINVSGRSNSKMK